MNYKTFFLKVSRRLYKEFKIFLQSRKLKTIRNKYQGQRCFILGNGPSLNLKDIEKLKHEVTFASNKIYLIFQDTDWRPTFYTSEDDLVLEQNSEIISNLNGSLKILPGHVIKYLKLTGDEILYKFYYPKDAQNPLMDNSFPKFSLNASQGLYWGSTVVYSQIQLAVHMGFKEIYLLGVDYSYLVPEKKIENMYISAGEQNHFHPNYRMPGEKWFQPNLDVHFRSFNKANQHCESSGIKIYNATRGGKLEIFERRNLDEIITHPS